MNAFDYEKLKDSLFPVMRNLPRVKIAEQIIPYKEIGDIAVVVLFKAADKPEVVNYPLLERWGLNFEQVFSDALKAAEKAYPLLFGELGAFLGMPSGWDDSPYMVTNEYHRFGASAILYDSCKNIMKDKKYIMMPSSIHEVLLVPYSQTEVSRCRATVRDINADIRCVRPEDVLSNEVFIIENGEIRVADK